MSAFHPLLGLTEQLCYVQCTLCNTILLVSVPCSSLLKAVTVRCGHCQGLLSVNMGRASFVPIHLLAPLQDIQEKPEESGNVTTESHHDMRSFIGGVIREEDQEKEKNVEKGEGEEGDHVTSNIAAVNKPPEKRQRAPSAYNRFIKEEIQRIKARDPQVSHKEAFSTAAKNWAHCPRIQQREDGESCGQKMATDGHLRKVHDQQAYGLIFNERKVSRHSISKKTPFS